MPTHTFPCPFCGRRMGVEMALLGRNVRCPHCKQVVLSPAPPPAAPTSVPVATPAPRAKHPPTSPTFAPPGLPPPASPQEIPTFRVSGREAADSILSDHNESEDEVFSSSTGGRLPRTDVLGAESLPPQSSDPAPAGENAFAFLGVPDQPAAPRPAPAPQPPAHAPYANPFEDSGVVTSGPPKPPDSQADTFDGLSTGAVPTAPTRHTTKPQPKPAPVLAPVPLPAAAPLPAQPAPDNPWAGFDQMVTATPAAIPPVENELPPEPIPPAEKPRSSARLSGPGRLQSAPASGKDLLFKVGFFLLLPYALLMTALAAYGLFFKTSKVDTGHPLSTIPDNFGEFPPAERKKVGKYSFPVGGPLPADLKVALGNALRVGALEVEPLRVESRCLRVVSVARAGNERVESSSLDPALVLRMRVRNTSGDLTLHPLDPAFTRKARASDQPPTGLQVGKQTFWGGALEWPLRNARVAREFESAQEADATPLKPGESREYVVFTDAKREIVRAALEADGPMLWRVQVRSGLVPYRGKEIPVTAIIGVEFNPADVQTAP